MPENIRKEYMDISPKEVFYECMGVLRAQACTNLWNDVKQRYPFSQLASQIEEVADSCLNKMNTEYHPDENPYWRIVGLAILFRLWKYWGYDETLYAELLKDSDIPFCTFKAVHDLLHPYLYKTKDASTEIPVIPYRNHALNLIDYSFVPVEIPDVLDLYDTFYVPIIKAHLCPELDKVLMPGMGKVIVSSIFDYVNESDSPRIYYYLVYSLLKKSIQLCSSDMELLHWWDNRTSQQRQKRLVRNKPVRPIQSYEYAIQALILSVVYIHQLIHKPQHSCFWIEEKMAETKKHIQLPLLDVIEDVKTNFPYIKFYMKEGRQLSDIGSDDNHKIFATLRTYYEMNNEVAVDSQTKESEDVSDVSLIPLVKPDNPSINKESMKKLLTYLKEIKDVSFSTTVPNFLFLMGVVPDKPENCKLIEFKFTYRGRQTIKPILNMLYRLGYFSEGDYGAGKRSLTSRLIKGAFFVNFAHNDYSNGWKSGFDSRLCEAMEYSGIDYVKN